MLIYTFFDELPFLMTDKVFSNVFLFSVEAIVFSFLTFLLWVYYRGFSQQYVRFWMISLLALCLNQIATAIQLSTFPNVVTTFKQLLFQSIEQASYYLFISFFLLGTYSAVKRISISSKTLGLVSLFAVTLGISATLLYGFDESTVFNRFYLRESLPAFLVGCSLLAVSFYLLTFESLHFSARVLTLYCLIIGARHILFSFLSITALTEGWFRQLTHILVFVDVGANTVLGFIMLIWMQGAERNTANSAIDRAQYLGKHDPLTGVLNRKQVLEKLPLAMESITSNGQILVIFNLDIKRFKFINDTYGLKIGDLVLGEIANRLNNSILLPKVVGRLGGDSFIFVIELLDENQQNSAVEHIHSLMSSSYNIQQQEVNLQCSVGYSVYPDDEDNAEGLMKQANLALFHAKKHKLSTVKYEEGMQSQGRHLLEMEKDIRQGITENEFVLYFQPQLNLISNRLEGVEALIRWQHPEKGLLTPACFLDDVETLGLSSEIDNYVLDKSCQTISSWYKKYKRRIPIAVNITAVEFQNPTFVAKVQALLFKYNVPPTCLELEITENVVITEVKVAMDTIVVLQNMGIKVSIDDFGTGYSSLAYLRELPIDKIKIDQSFIKEVASNDSDLTIVKSMIKLSHALGKRVLAEGVETLEQLNLLRNLGCDAVQGYFISKPLAEKDLVNYLKRK
ncbi:MAG: diguanylate cyclase (GGDEF)-like protein [Alteromonadaceae bacterium]|jgi:diguanylate cyclase (GGDEF)-like protein